MTEIASSSSTPSFNASAWLASTVVALVDDADAVRIEPVSGTSSTVFEVQVGSNDVRRVIGRGGRTAKALRTLLDNFAAQAGKSYHLQILEPTQSTKLVPEVQKKAKVASAPRGRVQYGVQHDD